MRESCFAFQNAVIYKIPKREVFHYRYMRTASHATAHRLRSLRMHSSTKHWHLHSQRYNENLHLPLLYIACRPQKSATRCPRNRKLCHPQSLVQACEDTYGIYPWQASQAADAFAGQREQDNIVGSFRHTNTALGFIASQGTKLKLKRQRRHFFSNA